MDGSYDKRYLRGIELFNKGEFFEAHEVWEDLWHLAQFPDNRFLQGLIQVAVALLHEQNENYIGADKVYKTAREYLNLFTPDFWELSVVTLIGDLDVYFANDCPAEEKLVPTIEFGAI